MEFFNNLIGQCPSFVQILIFIALLVVGTFCLVKFSDMFVDAASFIAYKLKVSPLIIGLTIVAIGTSCPELAVSVSDSITALINSSHANVAIGNVVGSNICNILLVLGCSCLFVSMPVKKSLLRREFPFLLIISSICVIFGIFFGLNSVFSLDDLAITRWEGIILVVLIFVYIFFLVFNVKRDKKNGLLDLSEAPEIKEMSLTKAIIFVILGALGIAIGGEFVVFGAKGIALKITNACNVDADLAESLIGLTIVAVGTSLPELVTSTIAAKKGDNELALGNVIGSNIFNIVFVLGISATVNPLVTGSQVIVDLLVMLGVTIFVFILAFKGQFKKLDGIILLSLYLLYLTYLIVRTFVGV